MFVILRQNQESIDIVKRKPKRLHGVAERIMSSYLDTNSKNKTHGKFDAHRGLNTYAA